MIMPRPTLLWLHDSEDDRTVDCAGWSEIGRVEVERSAQMLNECFGFGDIDYPQGCVVSIPAESTSSLNAIENLRINGMLLIAVRGVVRPVDWLLRLSRACNALSISPVAHDRTAVATELAMHSYRRAVTALRESARILMGPGVDASVGAMSLERATNSALDLLCQAAGIPRAPR